MRKNNARQVVGNLSSRGSLLKTGRPSQYRADGQAALEAMYFQARADCAKDANRKARRIVDALQNRIIRRQRRQIQRAYLGRLARGKEKVRALEHLSKTIQPHTDPPQAEEAG